MPVCALGDLLLDVIVRLETPVADGDDTDRRDARRCGRPGGERRGLGRGARRGGAVRRASARATRPGAWSRTSCARAASSSSARSSTAGTAWSSRWSAPTAAARWRPTAGVSPQLRPEELDMRWFRDCSWLHLSGYSLLRSPIDEAGAKAAGAVRALGGKVSVDLASASLIRAYGPERLAARLKLLEPDVVFANDDEVAAVGEDVPAATLVRKRGRRNRRRRRGAAGVRRPRSSTRPARATPSPPATSSAGRSSRSRRPLAAWRSSGRCRDRASPPRFGDALDAGGPVVALETTLVAHGFPPGEGLEVGLESERRVREGGAVPATIGVLDGPRPGRAHRERARALHAPRRASSGRATSPPAWLREPSARRRSAARSRSPRGRASASWAPAGSAASTAARSTSRPT